MKDITPQWINEFEKRYIGDLSNVNGGGRDLRVLVPIFEVEDFIRKTLRTAMEKVLERKRQSDNGLSIEDAVTVADIRAAFEEMGVISSDKE